MLPDFASAATINNSSPLRANGIIKVRIVIDLCVDYIKLRPSLFHTRYLLTVPGGNTGKGGGPKFLKNWLEKPFSSYDAGQNRGFRTP